MNRCGRRVRLYHPGMNSTRVPHIWTAAAIRRAGMAGVGLALGVIGLLAGCGRGGPPQRPPATVTVMNPVEETVADWEVFAGRLQSPETTNIQARVSGVITQTPFKEGQLVHEGDILFVI